MGSAIEEQLELERYPKAERSGRGFQDTDNKISVPTYRSGSEASAEAIIETETDHHQAGHTQRAGSIGESVVDGQPSRKRS
jgi:hypothetical protein